MAGKINRHIECPACGRKSDGCCQTERGVYHCVRADVAPFGFRELGRSEIGHLRFVAEADCRGGDGGDWGLARWEREDLSMPAILPTLPKQTAPTPATPATPPKMTGLDIVRDSVAMDGQVISMLAATLGLDADRLPVRDIKYHLGKWCWLERDLFGYPLAVGTRVITSGAKLTYRLGEEDSGRPGRGLTFFGEWRPEPGKPLLLVEGCSDVLALHEAGVSAVGRPSNLGGIDLLCDLAKLGFGPGGEYAATPVVVVGENDAKHDDYGQLVRWPGRDGAEKTAKRLSEALDRPVLIAYPPAAHKDARDWYRSIRGAEALEGGSAGAEIVATLMARTYSATERAVEQAFGVGTNHLPPAANLDAQVDRPCVVGQGNGCSCPATAAGGDVTAVPAVQVQQVQPVQLQLACPHARCLLLQSVDGSGEAQLIWRDCRKLDCPVCGDTKRRQLGDTVQHHFRELDEVWLWRCWRQDWASVRSMLRHHGADHVRIDLGDDTLLVASTVAPTGSHPFCVERFAGEAVMGDAEDAGALGRVKAEIERLRLRQSVVSFSRGWPLVGNEVGPKSSRWTRVTEISSSKQQVGEVLEAHGIEPERVRWRGTYWGWFGLRWRIGTGHGRRGGRSWDKVQLDLQCGEVLDEVDAFGGDGGECGGEGVGATVGIEELWPDGGVRESSGLWISDW